MLATINSFLVGMLLRAYYSLIWQPGRGRDDNAILTRNMREAYSLCDVAGDVATASLLENWIDESEMRTWFIFECSRDV
jgi:hypothetical protein